MQCFIHVFKMRTCDHISTIAHYCSINYVDPRYENQHASVSPMPSIFLVACCQCALLAATVAFLAVEKGHVGATSSSTTNGLDLELFPYYKTLSEGDSVIITEHGPFTAFASCDASAVSVNY